MKKMSMKTYNILMTILLMTVAICSWNDIASLRFWTITLSVLLMLLSQLTYHFEKLNDDITREGVA